ncbi:MAG: ATP-binding cassette domain-containing protein, partial [Mesorhizobium sp.]|nr:ATP-binding cassette domain-containing protein [Mesorhizobium sp.]
ARRAALARVMAPEPDILLLDEPTNHLDLQVIEWLEDELARTSSALIVISHDRRFLERVSRATVWLDRGQTRRLDRGFGHFEEWRDKVLEEEEREQHKLGRQIVREEHWLRYGVTARRKRNMRRLGELQTMRQRFRGHKGAEGTATMVASDAAESGKLVVEAKGIGKSFGDLIVVKDFSTRIQRGDRIGLVGPNGAGKTTLLKMLTGELAPDTGTIRLGVNLEIATLDQKREAVDPNETLTHYLTDGRGENLVINGEQRHVVSYMKDFLFKPEQARTPVRELSGGERARLLLARVLARPANLLVLDEPTNDLDMETLELLQELVAGFAGTVILVSHDRDFLDRTVTSTIAPEGNGRWIEYAGGYSDLLAQRGGTRLDDRKLRARTTVEDAPPVEKNPPAAAKSPATKLSFKQKFALENLPTKMAAVSSSIATLENNIADPAFYERDPKGFQKTIAALDKERATLTALEEEWLELEMLREELEG